MYHVIVNPRSKTGRGVRIWQILEKELNDRNIEYRVVLSRRTGHVIELTRKLCEKNLTEKQKRINIIVLGGDGTLNEVLQGITDFGRVNIGYIPTGSSNDMARDLMLPKDPVDALVNILDCKEPTLMDLGRITYVNEPSELSRMHAETIEKTRCFGVSSGIGFDAAVCEEALASVMKKILNRLRLGKLTYLGIALKQLIKAPNCTCTLKLDDDTEQTYDRFLFATVMIHQYEGGGFRFCPGADPTDGRFDVIIASGISKLFILTALPKALKGKHLGYKGIEIHSADRVEIKTDVPCFIHTDGEVTMKNDHVTYACEKEKIRFLM